MGKQETKRSTKFRTRCLEMAVEVWKVRPESDRKNPQDIFDTAELYLKWVTVEGVRYEDIKSETK